MKYLFKLNTSRLEGISFYLDVDKQNQYGTYYINNGKVRGQSTWLTNIQSFPPLYLNKKKQQVGASLYQSST